MARKETQKETVKQVEEPTADVVETVEKTETVPDEGNVIQPTAVAIRLRATHPQASYGRCGYRFFKDKDVEIPMSELDGDLIWVLENDPYLQLTFITEE